MAHSSISEEQQLREMRMALAAENEKRRLAHERLQRDRAYANSEIPAELKLRQALEDKDATICELRRQTVSELRSRDRGLPVHAEPRRLKPTEQA